MDFTYLKDKINPQAFSTRPLSILNPEEREPFVRVMETLLLETASKDVWIDWQDKQLGMLLKHARARSGFWRNRLGVSPPSASNLHNLPILTRRRLSEQSRDEGPLVKSSPNMPVVSNSSSGSSGTPVKFYLTGENVRYNGMRGIVQEIIEERDFNERRCRVSSATSGMSKGKNKHFSSKRVESWLGPLSNLLNCGEYRKISYLNSKSELLNALEEFAPVHLNCSPSVMDVILDAGGIEFLKQVGVRRWIQFAGHRSNDIQAKFQNVGIEISANYSSEETGPIAFECRKCPGHFHVTVSNVIVELDDSVKVKYEGRTLGRILVTHLQSFASPMIRYDLGDFGELTQSCPCGESVPTLKNIFGRAKQFLYLPDGRFISFYFEAKDILSRCKCDEYQIRQKQDMETIEIQLAGRNNISESEKSALTEFVHSKTGYEFNVSILPVRSIDWRNNPKQLGFVSEVSLDN